MEIGITLCNFIFPKFVSLIFNILKLLFRGKTFILPTGSSLVTHVSANRINTDFSPHLHCRMQQRPCQSGRNSEPTRSFSYTYLFRVLPRISFSSQAKGFAPNEDKSFAPGINFLLKLGNFGDIIKHIYLVFISFLPLFYLCYIYYFGLLIFCCQFVAISL